MWSSLPLSYDLQEKNGALLALVLVLVQELVVLLPIVLRKSTHKIEAKPTSHLYGRHLRLNIFHFEQIPDMQSSGEEQDSPVVPFAQSIP